MNRYGVVALVSMGIAVGSVIFFDSNMSVFLSSFAIGSSTASIILLNLDLKGIGDL